MNNKITSKKIIDFFITKIIIGIGVVVGMVALVEWLRQSLSDKTKLPAELSDGLACILEISAALSAYILLFKFYEKRQIKELAAGTFGTNALGGFSAGLIIQSIVITVIFVAGGYSIVRVNPASFLIPGFIASLTAGFVGEIILRGIIFRLTEEKLGTVIALIISALIFAVAHSGVPGATFFSVFSTAIQAGILFSAVYVFSRSLWFPIFLHFAWDLAEPGIYGAINPGISLDTTLLTSKLTGPVLLTGGQFGPGSSLQSTILCLITGLIFLWLAKRKNNFIKPYWKK